MGVSLTSTIPYRSQWIAHVAYTMTENGHEWKRIVAEMEKAGPVDPNSKQTKLIAEVNKYIERVVGAYAATAEDIKRKPRKKGFLEKMGDKAKEVIDDVVDKTA